MSETKTTTPGSKPARPVWKPAGKVHASEQPFHYPLKREFVEPDWQRLPGYKNVSQEEWETALWQRRHTVKNLGELKEVFGAVTARHLIGQSRARHQRTRHHVDPGSSAHAQYHG